MSRRAFTLIEMLVVVGVLVALFAISIPVMNLMKERARVTTTQGLVDTVATALTSYQVSLWPAVDGTGALRNYRAWDWNDDGVLDGYPEVAVPGITATTHGDHPLYASGYRGFLDTVRPEGFPPQFRGDGGRVIDAWGRPLRIAFAAEAYGGTGFGLWSPGPDGVDAPDDPESDDLVSWRAAP